VDVGVKSLAVLSTGEVVANPKHLDRYRRRMASLVEATVSPGTASGAGTGRGAAPANAQGEERYMDTSRCSLANCEDSTGPPGKVATAAEQSTAA
jgi:hypothetical protein